MHRDSFLYRSTIGFIETGRFNYGASATEARPGIGNSSATQEYALVTASIMAGPGCIHTIR